MNLSDRQLGRLNLVLRDATAKFGGEPEDRAIWEILDATTAQEVAADKLRQDQTLLQQHWIRIVSEHLNEIAHLAINTLTTTPSVNVI